MAKPCTRKFWAQAFVFVGISDVWEPQVRCLSNCEVPMNHLGIYLKRWILTPTPGWGLRFDDPKLSGEADAAGPWDQMYPLTWWKLGPNWRVGPGDKTIRLLRTALQTLSHEVTGQDDLRSSPQWVHTPPTQGQYYSVWRRKSRLKKSPSSKWMYWFSIAALQTTSNLVA